MQKVFFRSSIALLGLLVGALSTVASAQSGMSSSDQLELLRNLSPEQREQILEQMSGRSGAGTSNGTAGATRRNGKDTRSATDRSNRGGEQAQGEEGPDSAGEMVGPNGALLKLPSFKPEDSVLIEIGLIPPKEPEYIIPPGSPAGTPPVKVPNEQADAEPMPPADKKRLEALVDLIRSRNPYALDRAGALLLPGYPAIPLAGLNEIQATRRLMAEPSLRQFEVNVVRLPLARTGLAALKPFGYDFFDEDPSVFEPVTDGAVPADYVVGPGDQLTIQLYGTQNRTLRLTVGRDGRISFPELGPINVGGQSFSRVSASVESRVRTQMTGVRASVSVGDTRSIRVFVLGEAKYPGSYPISGLGTVTTALFASGGIKAIGSLRDIQLKRQGAVVRRVDLYDLLLRGDSSNDAKLQPGDVIFIPPVGPTVSIEGEARRPAIYELKDESQVADILQLAGGLTPEADTARVTLGRIDEQHRRVIVNVDVGTADGRSQRLRTGDVVRVARIRPQLDSGVTVRGHVHTPGAIAWRDGLRLSDVIPSVDELKPNADLGYLLVRRELPPDRRVVALSADLSRALRNPGGEADIKLRPRDEIIVFDLESGREREISRLLEEMRLQSRIDRPTNIVRVGGRVKVAGEYPLEPNMTVSDLIRAGGNLSDAAYGGEAELTRYSVQKGEARRAELITIDLAKLLMGDKEADVALQPFDFLNIKEIPEWTVQEQVTLMGEVKFPGSYPVKRGETLKSLVERAGGLTDLAFPEGVVFTRKSLREREQKQLDNLANRLQTDLATMALQAVAANQSSAAQASVVGQSLLTQIKAAKAVGRLVIDVDRALLGESGSAGDLVVQDGDMLLIPKRSQEVTVIGEVQNATSHLYRQGLTRDEYIGLSGGMSQGRQRACVHRASQRQRRLVRKQPLVLSQFAGGREGG